MSLSHTSEIEALLDLQRDSKKIIRLCRSLLKLSAHLLRGNDFSFREIDFANIV